MKGDRYPRLDAEALTAAQKRVHDRIVEGPRGEVVGPLRVWLQSPGLAERAQALGAFVRYDSGLESRLSELAILVTARIWSSGFEWTHHAPIARKAGISKGVIESIGHGIRPALADSESRAVFEVAVALHRDRWIDETTFVEAREVLGLDRLVDLVGICGYYSLISMTINAFEVPEGEGPALPAIDIPAERMFCDN